MQVQYALIKGHKRFPFLDTGVFEKTFDSPLVLIEGPNGSGKSSLLNRLLPFPADRKDFEEDGYEEYHISFRGTDYVLTTDYNTGKNPLYSFKRGSEELNTAGLVTAQKELVFKIFGINESIKDILIDKEKFSTMSLNTRKKVFSALTKLNIDHILRSHNKLKDQYNMLKMRLKSEQNQYNLEESRLVNSEDLQSTKEALNKTNETIDFLLSMRQDLSQWFTPGTHDGVYEDLKVTLKEKTDVISGRYTLLTSNPSQEHDRRIEALISASSSEEGKLDSLYNTLGELDSVRRGMGIVDGDTKTYQDKYDELNEEIERLSNMIEKFVFDEHTFKDVERAFFIVNDQVLPITSNMESNERNEDSGTYYFNRVTQQRSLEQHQDLLNRIAHIDTLESTIRSNIDVLSQIEHNLTCPSCDVSINIRDIVKNDQYKEDNLLHICEERNTLKLEIEKLVDYLTRCHKYFTEYQDVIELKKSTIEHLKPFWDAVDERQLLTSAPSGVSNEVNRLNIDITVGRSLVILCEERRRVKENLDLSLKMNTEAIRKLDEQFQRTEEQVQVHMNKRERILSDLKVVRCAKSAYETYLSACKAVEFSKDIVREHNLSQFVSSIQNTISNEIRDLRVTAGELSDVIRDHDMIEHTLQAYGRNIQGIESELKVLEALLDELSPKTGLIAQTISSFLNTIISNMNKTLAKIWSYRMVLTPIDVGNDVLNYRFKLEVGDSLIVDDISNGSTGQRQAIDLAFKLVLYSLLGFHDYLLVLDELGSNMDETHTDNMGRLVQSFATEGSFSQIFIISHKENMSFLRDIDTVSLG